MTEEKRSTTKLFVWGIPWKIRGAELREFFSPYGEIVFASVKLDRETRRSRGFGFVEFENEEDAIKAKEALDGADMEGRELKVDFAIERDPSERPNYNPDNSEEESQEESTEESTE